MRSCCLLFSICLATVVTGCSSQEKVIKPQGLVAKYVEGDFQVERLLFNGSPPDNAMVVEPGEELKIDLEFARNIESNSTPVYSYIVMETKENDTQAKGSHLILKQTALDCPPGKGRRSIKTTVEAPSLELADFAGEHTLGRYFYFIIAENGSEIVSQKISLAKK